MPHASTKKNEFQENALPVDENGDGKLDLLEFVVIFEATMAQSGVY